MPKSGVFGGRELALALRELGKGVTPSEVDHAAKIGLDPMLKDTRQRVKANRNFVGKYPGFPQPKTPRKGGHVDQGIVVRRNADSTRTRRTYKLGATRRARYLLHLLEFGTAPHWQPNFRGGFMHPGATPRPSLVPAFEAGKDAVPGRVGAVIVQKLAAKAAALGRKGSRRR